MTDREQYRQIAAEEIDTAIGSQIGSPEVAWLVTSQLQIQDWMILGRLLRKHDAEWAALGHTKLEAGSQMHLADDETVEFVKPRPDHADAGRVAVETVLGALIDLGQDQRTRVLRIAKIFYGVEA